MPLAALVPRLVAAPLAGLVGAAQVSQAFPGGRVRDEELLAVRAERAQRGEVGGAQRRRGLLPRRGRGRGGGPGGLRLGVLAPVGQHGRERDQGRAGAGGHVPHRVLEDRAGDRGGVAGRVPEREPAAGGLPKHRPPVDAQLLPDLLAVGGHVGDGQRGARGQRCTAVHPALVQADQQDRTAQQLPLDGHEVVTALAGPAVQEQQCRAAWVAADIREKPVPGDLALPGAAHNRIVPREPLASAPVRS